MNISTHNFVPTLVFLRSADNSGRWGVTLTHIVITTDRKCLEAEGIDKIISRLLQSSKMKNIYQASFEKKQKLSVIPVESFLTKVFHTWYLVFFLSSSTSFSRWPIKLELLNSPFNDIFENFLVFNNLVT